MNACTPGLFLFDVIYLCALIDDMALASTELLPESLTGEYRPILPGNIKVFILYL